ncbi:phosphodiester glycosidase family protein [Actinomadura harenae]|uniref:Phosphodiester glycosidase family protein n=1 Tax=Actinomadura harenae TaxID=2483351 RepID=A0A3M2MBT6_9ACTN|nr:phosphodiester glycosidase family protein [Actinomadura harenae]RMI47067.1 phosphodiester glycosidase family protein [Actinomadura harenae]
MIGSGFLRSWPAAVVAPLLLVLALGLGAVAIAYGEGGRYGINVLLRRGASTWIDVRPDDARLSEGIRLSLAGRRTPDEAAPVRWREASPGMDVAEQPVRVGGRHVDALLLTRIDPARYRFRVLNRPAGDRGVGAWMKATGAALVVNGSYFDRHGRPDTPVVSDGRRLGPASYQAAHGAFVDGPDGTRLVDLAGRDWRQAVDGARQAMVSYPMLIGADGRGRADQQDERWLANRSFLGQDRTGNIIVGTTRDAYFSLRSLAAYLPRAGLGLRLALNLDGGPVACQKVSGRTYQRDFCGRYETAVHGGRLQLLRPLVGKRRGWALATVLVAVPR